MQAIVSGEKPFKSINNSIAIGPSSSGYVLNFGVNPDGPWTQWDQASPADECVVVSGVQRYMWFFLEGNTDDVEVIL